ncbi:MAG TPA: hypothetical protein VLV87_00740 [Gammaproteobacteria bacterium]|nr:hypothetical protein [Gammaproteobacteria bacterium]
MRRIDSRFLFPNLWLAACVVVAALIAVHATGRWWIVFGAPLLVAVAVLSADVWHSRLRGWPLRPTPAALILAGAVVLAGLMIGWDDPKQVQAFLPVLCAVAATANLRGGRRGNCGLQHP